MKLQRPQIIVRVVAILAVLLSFTIFALFGQFCRSIASSPHQTTSQGLGIYALLSIIPLMFLWGAIKAWRFNQNGIISIYTSWFVFGLVATFTSLFFLHSRFWFVIWVIIAACSFVISFLVIKQKKCFK